MMKKLTTVALATIMAAALVTAPTGALRAQQADAPAQAGDQAQGTSWIHVRVDEADGAGTRINLPLSMARVALQTAGKEALSEHAEFGPNGDVSLQDIRRMWQELRRAEEGEYVDIREEDERIRIFRRDGKVFVQVDEDDRETVRVEAPVALVDALLSGEGEELNVEAAMDELLRGGEQQLVRIRDGETNIRVWIDDSNTQSG